ncbi:hypothetical protein GIB67_009613 [Kingdonia uniflora]|uniref:Uncharacterized protein n=1 Tax=Kingdonia uniflora TaxID=39325 RepID=A0A7J7M2H5_9MAGN|nr:hypothetical protein GIB67_009613 [Kingdonia uniflora]
MFNEIIADLLRPEISLSSWESSSLSSSSDEELFRLQVELLHEYGKMMIEMGEVEEKEQEATSSRRRGGSKRGWIDKWKSREHKLGEDSLNRDYFGDNPRFKCISFCRRFRMSEAKYIQKVREIRNEGAHFQLRDELIAHLWSRKGAE